MANLKKHAPVPIVGTSGTNAAGKATASLMPDATTTSYSCIGDTALKAALALGRRLCEEGFDLGSSLTVDSVHLVRIDRAI
jgi:hypothetical protein